MKAIMEACRLLHSLEILGRLLHRDGMDKMFWPQNSNASFLYITITEIEQCDIQQGLRPVYYGAMKTPS
jgi:hypothetical protein